MLEVCPEITLAFKRRKSMKKNRKILSLVLAVIMSAIMLVSASGLEIFIIASSEEYETYATSAKYLEILDMKPPL